MWGRGQNGLLRRGPGDTQQADKRAAAKPVQGHGSGRERGGNMRHRAAQGSPKAASALVTKMNGLRSRLGSDAILPASKNTKGTCRKEVSKGAQR